MNLRFPFSPEGLGLMIALSVKETPRCWRARLATLPRQESLWPYNSEVPSGFTKQAQSLEPTTFGDNSFLGTGLALGKTAPSERWPPPPAGQLGSWAAGQTVPTPAQVLRVSPKTRL